MFLLRFHNHRMRLKQHNPNAPNTTEISRETSAGGFDPIQFRMLLSQRLAGLNNLNIPPLLSHPYFPGNPEIANLIRGFPGMLNAEQMYGLDLSVKPDGGESEMEGSDEGEGDEEMREVQTRENETRSRRKPAAPQWVSVDLENYLLRLKLQPICGDKIFLKP